MAYTINKVILVGAYLAKNAECKHTQSGDTIASFSVCVNKSVKNSNGGYDNVPEFFDVVLWGKQAESLQEYLVKGQQVAIEGRLTQQSWFDNKTQQKRYAVKITADRVVLTGNKKGEQQNATQQTEFAQQEQHPQYSQQGYTQQPPPHTTHVQQQPHMVV